MQALLESTAVFRKRREALGNALRGAPALVAAGKSVPRNYADNIYPFRASSHFLYLVGLPIEGAFLFLQEHVSTLFVNLPGPSDRLWHGEQPGAEELAELTGCQVEPMSALQSRVSKSTLSVPAVDSGTGTEQARLLGREMDIATEPDLLLVKALVGLRSVHDEGAIRGLKRAAAATTEGHLSAMRATRPGVLEAFVRAAFEQPLTAKNLCTAYHSIVTVHGEVLHNHSHHQMLSEGDLLLIDAGAETEDGWAGDVTRTLPVSGKFSPTQAQIYDVVLAAQTAAIESIAPGVRYRDVHLTAARTLTSGLVDLGIFTGDVEELVRDGAHALFFPHGVGHLIGLDVHDMEDLGDAAGYENGRKRDSQFGLSYLRLDRDLAENMAVTIEPGFYQVPAILESPERLKVAGDRLNRTELAKFSDVRGIRIEDDILVTKHGPEVLTAGIPKTRAAVEDAIG